MSKLNLELKTIIFIGIILLFSINTVSATVIFQENFETQTTGNFTLVGGNPTFSSASPYGYFLERDPLTFIELEKSGLPSFTNFLYIYYVRIDPINDNYDFISAFADSSDYDQFLWVRFQNTVENVYEYNMECESFGNHCSGQQINTLDLGSYTDANGYVKITLRLENNVFYVFVNDILVDMTNIDISFSTSFEYINMNINSAYPFGFDEVSLNKLESPSGYDPSGYIFDNSGNPINNALITLSNSTWTDPCYGTHCRSDAFGYWNTDIFVNGTYDYVIYRKGYTTLTGSQIFYIGGTGYNYTIYPSEGLIHGFVSEYSNQQNTVIIPGNLKGLKSDMANIQGVDYKIQVGSTLSLPGSWNPDGLVYVLKLRDIDSNGQQAMIDVLYDGNVVYSGYDNPVALKGTIHYLSSSSNDINNYLNVYVKTIFRNTQGEIEFVIVSVSYETKDICTTSCLYGTLIQYIASVFINYDRAYGYIPAYIDFSNWLYQGTGSENYVVWNGADGQNFISEELFDVSGKDADTVFLKYIIPDHTENQYGGKIGYGYTDNVDVSGADWTVSPQFKDIIINAPGIYKQNDFMFSDIDQNGDGKIKVWLYFYGSAKKIAFDHELVAYCNNCNSKPVVGASVMYDQTHIVITGEDGSYSMSVPFGSDKIYYSKTGYESKNITHIFNSTEYDFEQNIMINRTNVTINMSEYELTVLPDPSNVGEKIRAYYTTVCDSPTYSAYHIAVYADVDYENELDRFNLQDGVRPCALDDISLPLYPMGSYTATLEGNDFLGALFGIGWEKILATNFTVRDTKPSVNWQSSKYYMNDTMKLNVWVLSGSENVSVFYPNNGTLLPEYPKTQSQTVSPVVYSFDTHSGYPPGIYSATITGGDGKMKTTILSPESNDNFTLSVPSSVDWGKSFVVGYTSPKSSQLYILDSTGMAVYGSVTVKDSSKKQYNTSSLPAKSQVLTVVLESVGVKRTANISVSYKDIPGGYLEGESEGDFIYNYKTFIFSNYGNSQGTLFFFGIIHIILFTIILASITKMPIMGMFGAMLGLGFNVLISFIPMFWGVVILIIAGLVFMGLMKKG